MGEYKIIQELRQLWSHSIMTWLQVMVPLATAVFVLLTNLGNSGNTFSFYPLLGWGIFAISVVTWRLVVHHIDRQIVGMYPRMLELEQQTRMETFATYYYNNLRPDVRRWLLSQQRLGFTDFDGWDYRRYRREVLQKCPDQYQPLLEVWDKFGNESVTDRGHGVQDIAVGLITIAGLTVALLVAFKLNLDIVLTVLVTVAGVWLTAYK